MSRVLVTGAGGAIGAAVVRQLAAEGREVIAHDRSAQALAAVEAVASELVAGELTDQSHLAQLRERLAATALDGVIAAHGIAGAGALRSLDLERMRAILAINAGTIPALFDVAHASLACGGGTFVAVASQAALRGEPDNAVYCASKRALVGWATALAAPLAAGGVHVRVLCPGRTESPLLQEATERIARAEGRPLDQYVAEVLRLVPLGRYARAEETAAAAVYLMAKEARPIVLAAGGGEVPY
jgi:short-subunit dehydrogenase